MLALLEPVAGLELQHRLAAVVRIGERVEHPVLGRHQRRQLGQDHVGHGRQVALALEHPGEPLEVGLQPVLLLVLAHRLAQVADHLVEQVLEHRDLAAGLHANLTREVALGHGGGHFRDRADLIGQVGRQLVDVVGQVLPDPRHLLGLGLAAELALDADLAGHARDLAGEAVELVDHRVDGVLELEELAAHVRRDLLAQVAVGDRGRDLCDVTHLAGQVAGHQVDVVGQLLPDATDLDRVGRRLAELALGAHLARHARDLGDEAVELVDHAVDRVLELQHLALDVGRDLLAQIAVRHRADHPLHLVAGTHEVLDHAVHRLDAVAPDLVAALEGHALGELALLADHPADPLELGAKRLVGADDLVQGVGDLARRACPVHGHPGGEVPGLDPAEHARAAPPDRRRRSRHGRR